MKLRYLRLQRSRPPLRDLALTFPQDPLLSAQPLSLRFIVGLNGSGKTTLLQTLAEIFATLDHDGQPPAFPLWLAYDLQIEEQQRTVYLSAPRSQPPALIVFEKPLPEETDWETFTNIDPHTGAWPVAVFREFTESLPGGGEFDQFLPAAVLAYTSGDTHDWKTIFAPTGMVLDESAWSMIAAEDERPPDWDVTRENEQRQRLGESQSLLQGASPETLAAQFNWPSHSFFVDGPQLTLAATLITLKHLADNGQNESLSVIFNELHLPWQAPLSLSLWVNLDPARLDPNRAVLIADLMKLATSIVREPEPSQWRLLVFDPLARVPEMDFNANPEPLRKADSGAITYPGPHRISFGGLTVNALLELLGGEGGKTLDVFRTLSDWQQNNLVRDVRLVLRKNDVEDALLFDWLSDGERMLLGRASLFYLLQESHDALLILDEPETHFNDAWKRRLVDMLDDALRDYSHQIVVSTHSSILLSDVFNTEIAVLQMDGSICEPFGGTFGTLPSEIMRDLFDADNPVGDRAKEYLDAVLTLVEFPEIANLLWRALDETPNPDAGVWMGEKHPFGMIIQIFNQREKDHKLPRRTPHQWLRLFLGLHRRTQAIDRQVTLATVLEMLFDYVGAGYYQFELRRQHRRLTQAGENASPS